MNKRLARHRRSKKTRSVISNSNKPRLCIFRSAKNIYAQVISTDGSTTVASASTVEKEQRESKAFGGNSEAAKVVGALIAQRAIKAGITEVAFDRSGFRYHGRVKALADAAREQGMKF